MVCSDKLPLVDFILHPAEWKVNREERDFTISLQRWQNVAVSFTKSSKNVREVRLTVWAKCDIFSMLTISKLNNTPGGEERQGGWYRPGVNNL